MSRICLQLWRTNLFCKVNIRQKVLQANNRRFPAISHLLRWFSLFLELSCLLEFPGIHLHLYSILQHWMLMEHPMESCPCSSQDPRLQQESIGYCMFSAGYSRPLLLLFRRYSGIWLEHWFSFPERLRWFCQQQYIHTYNTIKMLRLVLQVESVSDNSILLYQKQWPAKW